MKLHTEDDDRQTDAPHHLPPGDPEMTNLMAVYRRALVRQRFLQQARDQRPDGGAWAAVGGRPSRRPRPRLWRRSA